MERERINTIWNELIALDPSIKDHESVICGMMSDIAAVRPAADIDSAFRTGLRARLMLREMPIPSPFSSLTWVAFRLLPIGAVALLVFTFTQPSPTYIGPSQPTTVETTLMESSLRYEADETSVTPQAGGSAMPVSDTYMQSESTMSLKQSADIASPEFPMVLNPQPEGVLIKVTSLTIPAPAFVAIIASYQTGEQVIGVSPLLSVGSSENIPIYLKTRIVAEGIYRAEVYRDNGDRLFVWEEDTIFTDGEGNSWSVPLTVVSE